MTLDQFYAELRKVTEGGVKWELVNGAINCANELGVCPYLMVAGTKELAQDTARAIWRSADKDARGYDHAIRAKLLECCGLEERA